MASGDDALLMVNKNWGIDVFVEGWRR